MSKPETSVRAPAATRASRVLDIGCGANKVPGAIGMDINPRTAADVIHDLDDLPYPFADDRFDEVIGRHVIENVRDPMGGGCGTSSIPPKGGGGEIVGAPLEKPR